MWQGGCGVGMRCGCDGLGGMGFGSIDVLGEVGCV
jgi:hypothetical protein